MNGGFVGMMTADLHLLGAGSLKDKRKPLHGLKAALVKATGCSVSEVDDHDVLRRARISLAVVAADAAGAERLLDVAERIAHGGEFEVLSIRRTTCSLFELVPGELEALR